MSTIQDSPLSTPPRVTLRELSPAELRAARAVADVLVPRVGDHPAATEDPDFDANLARALAARRDAFDAIAGALHELDLAGATALRDELRAMSDGSPETFQALSSVIAGAWLLSPATRERIGYPGQRAVTFAVDAGTEELVDGLLDPVLERGPVARTPR